MVGFLSVVGLQVSFAAPAWCGDRGGVAKVAGLVSRGWLEVLPVLRMR
jgi:hypothetical protein